MERTATNQQHDSRVNFPAFPILLVEGNHDDAMLCKRTLLRLRLKHRLHIVSSGEEALDYLNGSGEFVDRSKHPLPRLLLLDLGLPKMDGLEVLNWIRKRPDFVAIFIAIMTGYCATPDIHRAQERGIVSFLFKPVKGSELLELIGVVGRCSTPPQTVDAPVESLPWGAATASPFSQVT
jgi:CheY-like chemotaxis protein